MAKEIRRQAGKSVTNSSSTKQSTTSSTSASTKKDSGGLGDLINDMKRRAGFEVEEEPIEEPKTTSTRKTTKKSSAEKEQDAGGLGSIFGKGIDLGNLGDVAGSIIKSIVLGGRSI